MKIKFDPEHTDLELCAVSGSRTRSKSRSMSGGGFTKAQRCEYMDLCRQMTSRDPVQVTRPNRDRLLAFLKDYVVEHAANYKKKIKREFIMSMIPLLFENPAMLEDPNFLGSYNIVAFQCSILFNIVATCDITLMKTSPTYIHSCQEYVDRTEKILYKFFSNDIPFENDLELDYEATEEEKALDKANAEKQLKKYKEWADYSVVKKILKNVPDVRELYYPHEKLNVNFIIVTIDYLYVQELLDGMLQNTFYCGLIYKKQVADGSLMRPFDFLIHDTEHAHTYINTIAIHKKMTNICYKLYKYIMINTFNKGVRYSILMILFFFLHEQPDDFIRLIKDIPADLNEDTILEDSMDEYDRFHDLDEFGLLIPKVHRGSEESVNAYLTVSLKRFFEYLIMVKAMDDPLPKRSELSGSAKKLLNQYLDKEVSVSGSPNVNKMKRLLQTRKVAKLVAQKARKSKSRSNK